jgi:hypothetical protein
LPTIETASVIKLVVVVEAELQEVHAGQSDAAAAARQKFAVLG